MKPLSLVLALAFLWLVLIPAVVLFALGAATMFLAVAS